RLCRPSALNRVHDGFLTAGLSPNLSSGSGDRCALERRRRNGNSRAQIGARVARVPRRGRAGVSIEQAQGRDGESRRRTLRRLGEARFRAEAALASYFSAAGTVGCQIKELLRFLEALDGFC